LGTCPGWELQIVVESEAWSAEIAKERALERRPQRRFVERGADMATRTETPRFDALARTLDVDRMDMKVAHELKNSLTAVKALVQLGSRNPAEAASHERLSLVERELTRMQETLRRYLSLGRPLEEIRPARIDLGQLVSDTLLLLAAQANDARVTLCSHGHAIVEADPRRLQEALVNLVTNGIEATPPGGEVVVHVRAGSDHAEIVVRDTGPGMPAETLHRLGTPFFTTREDGTGLGVVLARAVIVLHGGALHYESEPGNGTTVRATLPSRANAA
jgi:signal transduction histidine kinase